MGSLRLLFNEGAMCDKVFCLVLVLRKGSLSSSVRSEFKDFVQINMTAVVIGKL